MADVVYSTDPLMGLYQDHSDIRREAAEHTNEIVKEGIKSEAHILQDAGKNTNEIVREGLKGEFNLRGDVKDARYDVNSRITNATDRVVDRIEESKDVLEDKFYSVGRDTADIRAQIVAQQQQMVAGFGAVSKDIELNSLKGMLENQKNTQFLSDKIANDGEKTRSLINDLKYHDLNRGLVERNTELVDAIAERRHWRHFADQNQWAGQFAALQSQMQNFNSQLSETRQGMVNFGTMAGVGQTSTSNNVK